MFRRAGDRPVSRSRSRTCRRAIAAASSSRAIPTAASAASRATCARSRARSTASRCRRPKTSTAGGIPEFFRINFSRCIFCGFCEEACPTYAIQLTPDFEMGEYDRHEPRLRERRPADRRPRQVSRLQLLPRRRRGDRRQGQGRGGERGAAGRRARACCRERADGHASSSTSPAASPSSRRRW